MLIIIKHSATFQDIIAEVDDTVGKMITGSEGIQSVDSIEVVNPLIVVPQQDPQTGGIRIGLMPFSFNLKDDQKITLDASHFLTAFEASDELQRLHLRFTSNIEIASTVS